MTTTVAPATRLPVAIPAAIAAAWVVAIAAEATGRAGAVHHHELLEGSRPMLIVVGLAGMAWLLHIVAIMLPSSLPMLRLFATTSASQERPRTVLWAFVGGYSVVWLAFGLGALANDALLHELVHALPWLEANPWLPTAGVLALAGTFELTKLKDRCLDQCRHPAAFLMPRYRRGAAAAFRLGQQHGLFCVGCCWALMLVMFAAGLVDLRWMAVLGAVMIYEKVGRHGRRITPFVGVAMLTLAPLVVWQPTLLGA